MPHKVEPDRARGLVLARLEGPATREEVIDMVKAARALAHDRGWNILYDMRGATVAGISAGDIFWLPRRLDVLNEPEASSVRVAALHDPGEGASLARFWENAFRNAGLQACAFTKEDMRAWHVAFEREDPSDHARFLARIGLSPAEAATVREHSRAALTSAGVQAEASVSAAKPKRKL